MTDCNTSQQSCAYEHCDAIVPAWSAFCSRACERAVYMTSPVEMPISADGAMLSSLPPPRRHKAPRGSLTSSSVQGRAS